jgi:hypothetical protein
MPLPKPKRDPEANGPQDWTEHSAAHAAAIAKPTKKARKP